MLPSLSSHSLFLHVHFQEIVISGRKLGKVKERNEIKLKSPLFLRKLLMCQASLLTVKMGHYSTVQPVLSITGVLIVLHM